MLALPNVSGDCFTLTPELLAQGCVAAASSKRLRIILPLHRSQEALVQRMLNFLQPGTYIRPHMHPLPAASETIQVLQGAIRFCLYSESGDLLQQMDLEAGPLGLVDIEPGVWHAFDALLPDTVVLEVKRGPYDGAHDKVFAPWSLDENDAAAGT
jgi:cupin fold WbuC family metalloprotein